jgi:uncharacterized protein
MDDVASYRPNEPEAQQPRHDGTFEEADSGTHTDEPLAEVPISVPFVLRTRADEISGWGRVVTLGRSLAVAAAYLLAVAAAEMLTSRNPQLGLIIHAAILLGVLVQGAWTTDTQRRALLWTLALVPLIRLVSLTLPLGPLPPVYWYVAIGIPLFIGSLLAARALRYSRHDLGLRLSLRSLLLTFLMVPIGLILGALMYLVVEPRPLARELTLEAAWLPAVILLLCTGVVEELIFRGLLQRAAVGLFGPGLGLTYAAIVSTVLYLGYLSWPVLGLAFVIGVLFAALRQRSASLLPAILGHASVNISLFLIAPFVLLGFLRPPAGAASVTPTTESVSVDETSAETPPSASDAVGASPTQDRAAPAIARARAVREPVASPTLAERLVSPPFEDAQVTSLWAEPDAATQRIGAGSSSGQIALSEDGGRHWTPKAGPTGEEIRRIIISRFHPIELEIHVLTPTGYYVSYDSGDHWQPIRLAGDDERFDDLVLSFARNVIGAAGAAPLQVAETGEPFSVPDLAPPVQEIVAVAAHTRENVFVAYDQQGRVLFTAPAGAVGLALPPAGSVPEPGGPPSPSHAWPMRPVLDQDFTTAADSPIDRPDGHAWPEAEGYHLRSTSAAAPFTLNVSPDQALQNVRATLTVRQVSEQASGTYGLVVRRQLADVGSTAAEKERMLLFGVDEQANVIVRERAGPTWFDLLGPSPSAAVRQKDDVNDLTVQAIGPDISFEVNGIQVAHLLDSDPQAGSIEVMVLGPQMEIEINRLQLQAPD